MKTVQGIVYCRDRAVVLCRQSTAADSVSVHNPHVEMDRAHSIDRTRKQVGVRLALTISLQLAHSPRTIALSFNQCWHTPEPRRALRRA